MYQHIAAIGAKDIKILLRDRMAFALLLGMPIMLIVILSFALKSTFEQTPLAFDLPIIDHDTSARSQRLIELLQKTDGVTALSKPATSEADIRKQVRDRDYLAALVIPAGFADSIDHDSNAQLSLLINPHETGSGSVAGAVVARAAQQLIAADSATSSTPSGGPRKTPKHRR